MTVKSKKQPVDYEAAFAFAEKMLQESPEINTDFKLVTMCEAATKDETAGFIHAKKILSTNIPRGAFNEDSLKALVWQFSLNHREKKVVFGEFNRACLYDLSMESDFIFPSLGTIPVEHVLDSYSHNVYLRGLLSTLVLYCTVEAFAFRRHLVWSFKAPLEREDTVFAEIFEEFGISLKEALPFLKRALGFIWYQSIMPPISVMIISTTEKLLERSFLDGTQKAERVDPKRMCVATIVAILEDWVFLQAVRKDAVRRFSLQQGWSGGCSFSELNEKYSKYMSTRLHKLIYQTMSLAPTGVFQYSEYHPPFRPTKSNPVILTGFGKATQDRF